VTEQAVRGPDEQSLDEVPRPEARTMIAWPGPAYSAFLSVRAELRRDTRVNPRAEPQAGSSVRNSQNPNSSEGPP
jgi:hypothetical protein